MTSVWNETETTETAAMFVVVGGWVRSVPSGSYRTVFVLFAVIRLITRFRECVWSVNRNTNSVDVC